MSKIVKCVHCNKEIELKPSAVGRRKNNYCSRKCYNLSKRKYKTNNCMNCNNEFKVRKSEIKLKRFCNDECEKEFDYKMKKI